jgi:hypothetical protein
MVISSLGQVSGGTLLWTFDGELRVTVVLRTAYALAAGNLEPREPEAIALHDRHYADDPARAVRTPSDLAPRLPRAEVLHAGAVVAPAGVTMVRLAVSRDGAIISDKRAVAMAKNDSPGLGPTPRAAGEPACDANGVVLPPPGFDFGVYQRAPLDQQIDRLIGGDQIFLGNLHPDLAELAVVIPRRAPSARASLGRQEAPLLLACRRVLLDTDRRTYTLVWYGELELPGIAAVPHLRIEARSADAPAAPAAPVQAPPQPIATPTAADPRQLLQRIVARAQVAGTAAAAGAPTRVTAAGTVLIEEPAPARPAPAQAAVAGTLIVDAAPPPAAAALPFAPAPAPAPAERRVASVEATPWAGAAPRAAPQPASFGVGTMAIDVDPPANAERLPPPPAPPPPAPPAALVDPPPRLEPPAPSAPAKIVTMAEPRAAAPAPAPKPEQGSPWRAPEPAPVAPKPPPPPAAPKGPAAALASLKKDSNERFRKR